MRILVKATILCALLGLAGCAALSRTAPAVGDPVATVRAKFGAPTAVYRTHSGEVLEYATGPMGQYTWMAQIGPDGRLVSFEQVLSGRKFATIQIGVATRDDVLRTIGRPAETSYLSLTDLEVWSYRYREDDVWHSMMHVHFDRSGVVRKMENGPDFMYDKSFFRD